MQLDLVTRVGGPILFHPPYFRFGRFAWRLPEGLGKAGGRDELPTTVFGSLGHVYRWWVEYAPTPSRTRTTTSTRTRRGSEISVLTADHSIHYTGLTPALQLHNNVMLFYPLKSDRPAIRLRGNYQRMKKGSKKPEIKIIVIVPLSENLLIQTDLVEIADELRKSRSKWIREDMADWVLEVKERVRHLHWQEPKHPWN